MKNLKLSLLCVFILGFTIQSIAQVELPEVTIVATNYKYLNSVDDKDTPLPVKRLEREAAAFDLKNSEFYEDEYDTYFVSFYIPEGKILAAYDKDGKLLRTAEKYKNIKLPQTVAKTVADTYPQWTISKDAYLVSYYDERGTTKVYKLLLENGKKRMRVKINDQGDIIKSN